MADLFLDEYPQDDEDSDEEKDRMEGVSETVRDKLRLFLESANSTE